MSAKFEIHGKVYDIIAGLENASLQSLYILKVEQGIGMRSLMENAAKLEDIKDPLDILEDMDMFKVLMTVIWLARREAGEKISFVDANSDFGLKDLNLITDEADEPAAADPKAPAGSGPDDAPPPL